MSDRMPPSRRSSRGRHLAPAVRARPRLRDQLRPGRIAQGALAVALVLCLGGYVVAESTTQRTSAVAVQQARAEVAGERAHAVASAHDAVADAASVQTVAAGSVPDDELAPLTAAVAELTALIETVPAAVPGAAATTSVDSTDLAAAERASRGVTRGAVPDALSPSPAAAPASDLAATPSSAPSVPPPFLATAAPTPGAAATGDVPAEDAQEEVSPDDDLAAGILAATARVADLTAEVKTTATEHIVAAQAAAATSARAAEAAAEAERQAVQRASLAAYANGRVPKDALCELASAPGQQLRCDATAALGRLNDSFRAEFGADLTVTDSYRSYSAQVACARSKGRLCARPGTSNHGRGVAVDLGSGVEAFDTAEHRWMEVHAGEFGWVLPDWASKNGHKSEPWHWEFVG